MFIPEEKAAEGNKKAGQDGWPCRAYRIGRFLDCETHVGRCSKNEELSRMPSSALGCLVAMWNWSE
jgi:hypothetical protein